MFTLCEVRNQSHNQHSAADPSSFSSPSSPQFLALLIFTLSVCQFFFRLLCRPFFFSLWYLLLTSNSVLLHFHLSPLSQWSFHFPWLQILSLCPKYQIYIPKAIFRVLVSRCLSALLSDVCQRLKCNKSAQNYSRCGSPFMTPKLLHFSSASYSPILTAAISTFFLCHVIGKACVKSFSLVFFYTVVTLV